MTDPVLYETRNSVAIVTLNRPAQRNSIDVKTSDALRTALARLEADPEIRVGILAGAGPVFCAGMDLKTFARGDGDAILFGAGRFGGLIDAPRRKVLIAAVDGPALRACRTQDDSTALA